MFGSIRGTGNIRPSREGSWRRRLLAVNVVVGIISAIFGAWFIPDIARMTEYGHIARMYPTPLAIADGAITATFALWALRFVKNP